MSVDTRLLDAIMLLVQFRISFAEFPAIGSRVGSVLDVALGFLLWRITDAAIQSAIPESFPVTLSFSFYVVVKFSLSLQLAVDLFVLYSQNFIIVKSKPLVKNS